MNRAQLENFVVYLQKQNWSVFGPVFVSEKIARLDEELSPFLTAHLEKPAKPPGIVLIQEVKKASQLILDGSLPFFPFKKFFVPEKETLFSYHKNELTQKHHSSKVALIGMNILDLKAINLYDQVFEKDPYYQRRRRNILIVGCAHTPDKEDNFFDYKFEKDILEHLPFDIFLTNSQQSTVNSQLYKIFTGSLKGQRILEHFGYKNYQHIQFSGPVKEGKPDERMKILRDKLKNHHNPKIWEELGKRCIECGKCTIACPTCFCFRIDDEPSLEENSGRRNRCWDSCYYQEFSEVSGLDAPGRGKPRFLNNTAQRIHFWYFHKFARIPDEFDFMGCVGCGRCHRVCPVNIDIKQVLKDIENT